MDNMGINASLASGAMASALQQQTLGAQLIDKTLQQSGSLQTDQTVAVNPPHKGNALDMHV